MPTKWTSAKYNAHLASLGGNRGQQGHLQKQLLDNCEFYIASHDTSHYITHMNYPHLTALTIYQLLNFHTCLPEPRFGLQDKLGNK